MKIFNKTFSMTLVALLLVSSVFTYAEEIKRPSAHGESSKTVIGPGAGINDNSNRPLIRVYGANPYTVGGDTESAVAANEDINTFVSNYFNQKVANNEIVSKKDFNDLLATKNYTETEIITAQGGINWTDYIVSNINKIVNEKNKEDIPTKAKIISKHLDMGYTEYEINLALTNLPNIDFDKATDDTIREILAGAAMSNTGKVSERFVQNFTNRGLTEEELLASLSRIQGRKVEVNR